MGCMAAVYSNGCDIGRMSWDISIETLSPSSLRGRADDLSAVEPTTAPNKPAVKQTTAADNSCTEHHYIAHTCSPGGECATSVVSREAAVAIP